MNLRIATEIGKCLSNKIRFQILEWLKEPEKHFPPHETLKHFNDGVCVTYIQEKQVCHNQPFQHTLQIWKNVAFSFLQDMASGPI